MLNGYDEALVLNERGYVCEGSAENLFILRGGKLITPPVYEDILEGITRDTIIELAKNELGLETIERPIGRTELYVADAAFYCGTGVQVVNISKVDHRVVGDGKIGAVVKAIRDLYFDVVRGKVAKYKQWCTPVFVEEKVAAH